jgi:hypothetical protein
MVLLKFCLANRALPFHSFSRVRHVGIDAMALVLLLVLMLVPT